MDICINELDSFINFDDFPENYYDDSPKIELEDIIKKYEPQILLPLKYVPNYILSDALKDISEVSMDDVKTACYNWNFQYPASKLEELLDIYNWSNIKNNSLYNLPFQQNKGKLDNNQLREAYIRRRALYVNKYFEILGEWSNPYLHLKMMENYMKTFKNIKIDIIPSKELIILGNIVIVTPITDLSLLKDVAPNSIIYMYAGVYKSYHTKNIIIPVSCTIIGLMDENNNMPIIDNYNSISFLNITNIDGSINNNIVKLSSIYIKPKVYIENNNIFAEDVYLENDLTITKSNIAFLLSTLTGTITTVYTNLVLSYCKINSQGEKSLVMRENNRLCINHCDIYTNMNITVSYFKIMCSFLRCMNLRIKQATTEIILKIGINVVKDIKIQNKKFKELFSSQIKYIIPVREVVYNWMPTIYCYPVFDINSGQVLF